MNPFKRPVLKLMVALVSGAAAAGAFAADAATPADVSAMQGVAQSWVQAYAAGDAYAVAALYADDAILQPPGAPVAVHKDAIRNFFVKDIAESKQAGYTLAMSGTPTGGVAGDWGWLSSGYTETDASGKTVDSGKFLCVFRKVDGKWLFLRDIWNSDGGIPKIGG